MWQLDDCIAAMASPPGAAARSIIRISGGDLREVLATVFDPHWSPAENDRSPRRHSLQISLDDGLTLPADLLFWPGRRSFTGEPLAELHLIGSPPLCNEALTRVLTMGARPAQPGEFTLRAFLNGRIDLVQAEAVLGVIDAGSRVELSSALQQLAGGISNRIAEVREQLLLHLADLEAGLDFVEEDIEFVDRSELLARLEQGTALVRALVEQARSRAHSAGRYRVVLAGLPNAGKSTLFNHLARSDTALVSPQAGTTRDYLALAVEHQGLQWEMVDTAGWEIPRDEIEAAAARQRADQLRRAQLVLWCTALDLDESQRREDAARLAECREDAPRVLQLFTKADLADDMTILESVVDHVVAIPPTGSMFDSKKMTTPEAILDRIAAELSTIGDDSDIISSTAARCEESLRQALEGLEQTRELASFGAGDELIALELRSVLDHLGRVVGQVYTDDILDRIFSRFCIGK